jgi:RNA polymerase sigma factor (sigma-70 family)
MDIPDGDLVRLAQAGDRTAFRLLVERHQRMARACAARLCRDPHEVDDIVQEAFLQALVSLDRLRDPDRFAGWLSGIVRNVHRAMLRRDPLTLLADWPDPLHPASAAGVPSADDLDRADALRRAVADLPAGQRRAVAMYYYADLPAGQISQSPGAAKAALHKARRRLREYLTAHRPDLVPATRRPAMTTVRIAHAEPRPSRFFTSHVVVVLSDDAGGRALPIWLTARDGSSIWRLVEQQDPATASAAEELPAAERTPPEQTTDRLLRAVGASVTAVEIDELGPDVTAARIELAGPGGTRQVTARLADGLALAAAARAPVRVADAVMARLAQPVTGDDLLGPFLDRAPAAARPVPVQTRRRRRYEPRNLAFTEGLDGWQLGGGFLDDVSGSHWQDYKAAAGERSAALSATAPEPYGLAFLTQEIFADDYRGLQVVLTGELRTAGVAGNAGLFVRVVTERQQPGHPAQRPRTPRAARDDPANHFVTAAADQHWTAHEVTAEIPDDAATIAFGIFLSGPGVIELRDADLARRDCVSAGTTLNS